MRSYDDKEELRSAVQTPVAHLCMDPWPHPQLLPADRSQLTPGTHRALGHDIQVFKGPIKGEVSAHGRPLLDALCDVWVAITSGAQVDLRSQTTRAETQAHGQRPKAIYLLTMKQFTGRFLPRQYRSHHPALGQKSGDHR